MRHRLAALAALFLLLPRGGEAADPATMEAESKAYRVCIACHGKDGKGMVGPSLLDRLGPLAASQAGRDYLVMVLSAGVWGPMEVDGRTYNMMMVAQRNYSPAQKAAAINHVWRAFNAESLPEDWEPLTAAEVEEIIARYPDADPRAVHAMRDAAFAVDD